MVLGRVWKCYGSALSIWGRTHFGSAPGWSGPVLGLLQTCSTPVSGADRAGFGLTPSRLLSRLRNCSGSSQGLLRVCSITASVSVSAPGLPLACTVYIHLYLYTIHIQIQIHALVHMHTHMHSTRSCMHRYYSHTRANMHTHTGEVLLPLSKGERVVVVLSACARARCSLIFRSPAHCSRIFKHPCNTESLINYEAYNLACYTSWACNASVSLVVPHKAHLRVTRRVTRRVVIFSRIYFSFFQKIYWVQSK